MLDAQTRVDHRHQADTAHHAGLHFSHPLFTESVSPDTKTRVNVGREWEGEGAASEFELEVEYAFHRSFSIEIGAPFAAVSAEHEPTRTALGNLEVLFKFANYAFEDHGLLLGSGVEVSIPTGDDAKGIGSSHLWEVAPVLNVGYKRGRFEWIGFTRLSIPLNQSIGEEIEPELVYDASGLVNLSPRFQGVLELNGETVVHGGDRSETVVRLSPGAKVALSTRVPLFLGIGVRVPLTDDEMRTAVQASLFYHF
jgi:hypothetical protein